MGQDAAPLEPPDAIRRRLDLDDTRLRGECVVHTHRVGGPGGQHRNKTESAVRLLHRPSGVVVTGEERRSQHQNAASALLRLREAIAVRFRAPLPAGDPWPEGVQIRDRKLRVSERNPAYFHALGLVLDALAAAGANPAPAAALLGVSTSSLVRFLADNPRAWQEANRLRSAAGLGPLHHD
ncbi:MAG: peptide chain release factor-like protein [Planctomycetia bacterium]|nr:MAG: peptide chain release factor-like protein [Planctomycetia bacterium]